jgi:hypothetical protein
MHAMLKYFISFLIFFVAIKIEEVCGRDSRGQSFILFTAVIYEFS